MSAAPGKLEVLEKLREDFSYFETRPEIVNSENQIVLCEGAAPPRRGLRVFATRACVAYGLGSKRYCDYGSGTAALLEDHGAGLQVAIYGGDADHVYETAFSALLSIVGERLDRDGFHRVHALAFSFAGKNVLLPLEQGAGKSAMGLVLLENPAVRVYSDETPLLRGGVLYPFPARFALSEKVARALGIAGGTRLFKRKIFPEKLLFPVRSERVAAPAPVGLLLRGLTAAKAPRIEPCSKPAALEGLLKYMVVGFGVAQMREYMLRLPSAGRLAAIAASRLREAWRVAGAARTAAFHVGPDARENARVLLEFLRDAQ
ncbi:MAG TPA: hypothetical protein VFV50_05585 [Bdellovibrionales bacterium]|nr:hypothetical protein [Bdellovibrionales bacterium]